MNRTSKVASITTASLLISATVAIASTESGEPVADSVIAGQRETLAIETVGFGFGPQSPRDIDRVAGENTRSFSTAPPYTDMNLCNIHFHESAEHRGGEFTTYAGNGDGEGNHSGYEYSGSLSEAELMPLDAEIGASEHGSLVPGDTIEVHYVYSTAKVLPGPTLGSCLSEAIGNPQLRVEAQVMVLVNDESALDFVDLSEFGEKNGFQQAINIPTDTGTPVQYSGSTTGPGYNTKGSPYQVSWSVHPQVVKVDIHSVGKWLDDNAFDEDHAHGVRNLVTNPKLLSDIEG